MPRKLSSIAPDWWDYTTLDDELIRAAARLTPEKMLKLSRPGFRVVIYDTLEEFYLAEALEYITAWRQSTEDNPVGICGPIGLAKNCGCRTHICIFQKRTRRSIAEAGTPACAAPSCREGRGT